MRDFSVGRSEQIDGQTNSDGREKVVSRSCRCMEFSVSIFLVQCQCMVLVLTVGRTWRLL